MNQRPKRSGPPTLAFTSDFHQLVRGRLDRGAPATISYDPRRVVPPGEPYTFGSGEMNITAHVQCKDEGPVLDVSLVSWSGVMEFIPTTTSGIGPTLRGVFEIPRDAEWVRVWFSCTARDGRTWYDSRFGSNYTFRFEREDLELLHAEVLHREGAPTDLFVCRVASDASIERMQARYRTVNSRAQPQDEVAVELTRTGRADDHGHVIWETQEAPVPHGAVLAFDLIYFVDGERFKDDNRGQYFVAAEAAVMAGAALPDTK